jgi:V/A-type H+-transporting ATPase subunit C
LAKLKDTDYLFSTARVRGAERNLLSREKVEKMIDGKTPADSLKVLYELDYGNGETVEEEQFEVLLTQEHKKAYDFIMSIAPRKDDFLLFLYPYDYHNVKALLKAEFLGTDPGPVLMDTGSIDIAKLSVMVRERNLLGMTDDMKTAINEVVDTFARTNDPQVVDLILDKACYQDMLKAAKATENSFIMGYVQLLIDTVNLKTFVRLRKMDKGWDFFQKVFLPGGNIPEKLFISSYDEDLAQFAERLLPYGLQPAMAEGSAMLKETGMFTALEKQCDNRLLDYVKDAKYQSFGVEPLVGYLIAKENEIKTARIIMAGKLAKLSNELIRERLRETYV